MEWPSTWSASVMAAPKRVPTSVRVARGAAVVEEFLKLQKTTTMLTLNICQVDCTPKKKKKTIN